MKTPYYFGFGSLVNEHTLPDNTVWHRARLSGWRRSWRHPIPGEPAWAAMDVVADASAHIEGLVVVGGPAIDDYLVARESGYRCLSLRRDQLTLDMDLPDDAMPCLWVSNSASDNQDELYLMQSYVDVVMAGYLRNFGTKGLQQFIKSTDNWHLPTYNDRQAPRYPRPVCLSDDERGIIDSLKP